jgi:hypothetical protein
VDGAIFVVDGMPTAPTVLRAPSDAAAGSCAAAAPRLPLPFDRSATGDPATPSPRFTDDTLRSEPDDVDPVY